MEPSTRKQNNNACGSQLPYGHPLCKQGRCVNDFVGKVVSRKKKYGIENPNQQLGWVWLRGMDRKFLGGQKETKLETRKI